MNKKGFTLIELVAALLVLGVIILICFPLISDLLGHSANNLSKEQINNIEDAAKKWALYNLENEGDFNEYFVSLKQLKDDGYIEDNNIINPSTNEKMNGCIKITYDLNYNSYKASYKETTCSNY